MRTGGGNGRSSGIEDRVSVQKARFPRAWECAGARLARYLCRGTVALSPVCPCSEDPLKLLASAHHTNQATARLPPVKVASEVLHPSRRPRPVVPRRSPPAAPAGRRLRRPAGRLWLRGAARRGRVAGGGVGAEQRSDALLKPLERPRARMSYELFRRAWMSQGAVSSRRAGGTSEAAGGTAA